MTRNKWINRWIARPMTTAHPLMAAVAFALYGMGFILPNARLVSLGYWCIFFLILEYIVHKNLNAAYHFLNSTTEASALPVQQIKSVNLAVLVLHTSVTALAMLFVPRLGLNRLLLWLKDSAIWLIRLLVSLLFRKQTAAGPYIQPESASPVAPQLPMETTAPPQWLSILFSILEFCCTILVIVLAVSALCYGIWQLYMRWIARQHYEGELREFISPIAEKQRLRGFRRPLKHSLLWNDFSPSATIRKLYIKSLNRAKPKNAPLPPSHTPQELEQLIFQKKLDPLHHYYEKARYSKDGCSRADLEKARKSL